MGMAYLKPSNGSRKNQKLSGGDGIHEGIGGGSERMRSKAFNDIRQLSGGHTESQ
jgi:hypothetical protein